MASSVLVRRSPIFLPSFPVALKSWRICSGIGRPSCPSRNLSRWVFWFSRERWLVSCYTSNSHIRILVKCLLCIFWRGCCLRFWIYEFSFGIWLLLDSWKQEYAVFLGNVGASYRSKREMALFCPKQKSIDRTTEQTCLIPFSEF